MVFAFASNTYSAVQAHYTFTQAHHQRIIAVVLWLVVCQASNVKRFSKKKAENVLGSFHNAGELWASLVIRWQLALAFSADGFLNRYVDVKSIFSEAHPMSRCCLEAVGKLKASFITHFRAAL
jgi:hypothetical protein